MNRETPLEMADRFEREAMADSDSDQRDYGLMVAAVIRRQVETEGDK